MKLRAGFRKFIKKIEKLLARLKKEKKRTQVNKIKNE